MLYFLNLHYFRRDSVESNLRRGPQRGRKTKRRVRRVKRTGTNSSWRAPPDFKIFWGACPQTPHSVPPVFSPCLRHCQPAQSWPRYCVDRVSHHSLKAHFEARCANLVSVFVMNGTISKGVKVIWLYQLS